MTKWHWLATAVIIATVSIDGTFAQTTDDSSEAERRAARYVDALRKRPSSSYLFDRLYDTWLTWGSAESLADHLRTQAAATDDPADHLILAQFHARSGDLVEGIRVLESAADADAPAIIWFFKAELEARTLDFDAALADLDRAAAGAPDDDLAERIGRLRGRLHARRGDVDDAVAAWEALLERRPDDLDLREDLVELLLDEGFHDQALESAEALLDRIDDAYRWVRLKLRVGDIQLRAGRRSDALSTWEAALARTGRGTWLERETLALIAAAHRDAGDLTPWRERLERLAADNHDRIAIHQQLADVYGELGDNDAAIEAWRGILARTPGDRSVREAYVNALIALDNIGEAAAVVEALTKQHADDAQLLLRLAELRSRADAPDDAAAAVERFLAVAEPSTYNALRAARLFESFDMPDRAEAAHRAAVEGTTGGDRIAARETLAAFLHRVGRHDEARAEWRALADGADVITVLRVADAAAIRGEREFALGLLEDRTDDHADDPLFMAAMTRRLSEAGRATDAVPWALARLRSATDPRDVETALDEAALAVRRAGVTEQTIDSGREAAGDNERALHAILLESIGEVDEAEATLDGLAEQSVLLATRTRIRLYEARHDWAKAAEAIETLVGLPNGRRPATLRRLVAAHRRSDALERALEWTQAWRDAAPGASAAWLVEAEILEDLGRGAEALDVLRDAGRRFDTDTGLQHRLARLYAERMLFAEAERIYWRMHEDATDRGQRLQQVASLAEVARTAGTLERLIEIFQEQRRLDRADVEPVLALAEIHRVAYDRSAQRDALAEATRLAPDDLGLLHALARLEEREHQLDRALVTLERASALDTTQETRRRMARLHFALGDDEAGYAILWELAGSDDIDLAGLESLALMMAARRDWEFLVDLLQRERDDIRADHRLTYLLAIGLEEIDQFESALETFVDVLDIDVERPGRQPLSTAQVWLAWYGTAGVDIPHDARELLLIGTARSQAYDYRRRAGTTFLSRGPAISLPDDTGAAHRLAVAHLIQLSGSMEEDAVDEIEHILTARGVPAPRMLLDDAGGEPWSFGMSIDPEAGYADDPAVLAYAVLSGAAMRSRDVTLLRRAHDAFADTSTHLALQASLGLAHAGADDAAELLEDALDRLDDDAPSVFVVTVLSEFLQLGELIELPEELHAGLVDRIVRWYPSVATNVQAPWAFIRVAESLMAEADGDALVRLLDDEVARHSRSSAPAMGALLRGGGFDLTPMTFPPPHIPGLPEHVLSAVSPAHSFVVSVAPDAEMLGDAAGSARHPALRVLLAHLAEDVELVERTLAEMLEADQPSLDACVLNAAWRGDRQDDPIGAVELLERARQLPMQRDVRQRIDTAILAWAVDSPEDAETTRDSGRRAALRLTRHPLSANHQLRIVGALEELGFESEAAQIERRAAASTPASGGMPNVPRIQPGSVDAVRSEATSGDLDAATKSAVRLMESLSRSSNALPPWEFERLVDVIESHKLTDPVLESLDRGESASVERRMTFAWACQQLGRPERAREEYEAIVAQGRRADAARLRLALLVGRKDPASGVEYLAEIPENRALNQLGVLDAIVADASQFRYSTFSSDAPDNTVLLNIYDMTARWMATLERPDRADYTLVLSTLRELEGSWRHGRTSLRGIFVADAEVAEEHTEVHERRLEVHRALCMQLLRHPATSRQAFGSLLRLHEAGVAEFHERDDVARAILLQPPMPAQVNMWFASNAPTTVTTPEHYLVRRAWRDDARDQIDAELIPALRAAGRGDTADDIGRLADIYFCEPDAFAQTAKAWIDEAPRRSELDVDARATIVIAAIGERTIVTDILDIVTAAVEASVDPRTGSSSLSWVLTYLTQLEPDAVGPALEAISTALVGPREMRAALIDEHRDDLRFGGSMQGPVIKLMAHQRLLDQCMNDERVFIHALRELRAYPDEHDQRPSRVRSMLQRSSQDTETLVEFLGRTPLTADAETFDLVYYGDAPTENLLTAMLNGFDDTEQVRRAHEHYAAIESPTFGEAFLRIMLGQQADLTARLLDEVGARIDVINGRDDAFQDDLARWFVRVDDPPEGIGESGMRAHAWLTSRRSNRRHPIDDFLAVERFRDLDVEPHLIHQHAASLIQQRNEDDAAQILAVIAKARELYDEAARRGRATPTPWLGVGAQVVQEWLQAEQRLDTLILLDDVLGLDAAGHIRFGNGVPASGALWQVKSIVGYDTADHEERVRLVFERMCDRGSDRPISVGVLAIHDQLLRRVGQAGLASLAASLDRSLDATEHPERTRDLLALGRLQWLRTKSDMDDELATASRGAIEAWLAERLADETLPMDHRLWLLNSVCDEAVEARCDGWLDDAIVLLASAVADDEVSQLGQGLDTTLAAFLAAPSGDDWTAAATVFADAAFERIARDRRSTSGVRIFVRGGTRRVNNVRQPPTALLLATLAASLDRGDDANRLLSDPMSGLQSDPGAWLALARLGQPAAVARAVRQNRDALGMLDLPAGMYFDAAVETVWPECRDAIGNPSLALAAEAILASGVDPDPLPEGMRPRHERMVDLARRAAAHDFDDAGLRRVTIGHLAVEPEAATHVMPLIAEIVDTLDIVAMMTSEDVEMAGADARLIGAYLRAALADRDSGPWIEATTGLGASRGMRAQWQAAEYLGFLRDIMTDDAVGFLSSWPDTDLAPWLPVLRTLTYPGPSLARRSARGGADIYSVCLIAHAMAGEHETMTQFRTESGRQNLPQARLGEITAWATPVLGIDAPYAEETRVTALSRLFGFIWRGYEGDVTIFSRLEEGALLSGDAILQHGRKFLYEPAHAPSALDLAVRLTKADRDDDAEEFWTIVRSDIPAASTQRLTIARAAIEHGRLDLAESALGNVEAANEEQANELSELRAALDAARSTAGG